MPTTGTQLNIMIDPEKRDKFKTLVRGQGKTVNDVINELIDQYLAGTNLPSQSNLDEKIERAIHEVLPKEIEAKISPIIEANEELLKK